MLTQRDLNRIAECIRGLTPRDDARRLAEALAECWQVLDGVARLPGAGGYPEAARRLLKKQGAPGWAAREGVAGG